MTRCWLSNSDGGNNMSGRAWMIGLLIIMAVICSAALAFVNDVTAPVIKQKNELTYMRRVLDVFEILYEMDDVEGTITTYKNRIEEREGKTGRTFVDTKTGRSAISVEGGGFQGPISLLVSLDGDTIAGFRVVSQVETPGLGQRITEESFQQSFIGKKVDNGIKMTKSGNAGETEFDAITGATETSKALEKMLNRSFETYFGG